MNEIQTLELDRHLPMKIRYTAYGPHKAQCEAGGLEIVPAEPASVEIMSLSVYGVDLLQDIPEAYLRKLEERVLEEI